MLSPVFPLVYYKLNPFQSFSAHLRKLMHIHSNCSKCDKCHFIFQVYQTNHPFPFNKYERIYAMLHYLTILKQIITNNNSSPVYDKYLGDVRFSKSKILPCQKVQQLSTTLFVLPLNPPSTDVYRLHNHSINFITLILYY